MIGIFVTYMFFVQLVHSLEELVTGFHKQWYLFSMPFWVFLLFEVLHTIFWALAIFTNIFSNKLELCAIFMILMFANGVQHIVWGEIRKKYVPGLITAPAHIVLFLIFYSKLLTKI